MPDHMPRPVVPLVEVDDLHVRFSDRDETVWAVNGVSFALMPGEVLCIIGESGSGKSGTMRALMRLLPRQRAVINGRIRINQNDILALDERQLATVRGSTVAMVFQEPTTALDASVQIQILLLLRRLQRELGMGLIFVTHDLSVAAQIADKIAVMYAGRIVEFGAAGDVLLRPRHPYTMGLLASTLRDQLREQDIEAIPGHPPDLRLRPDGCSFAGRCKFARTACRAIVPPPHRVAAGHAACCVLLDELPPTDIAPAHPVPGL